MSLSRREFIGGTGAVIAATAVGCKGKKKEKDGQQAIGPKSAQAGPKEPAVEPHYLVLVTLRGGYDPVLSVDPKDPDKVGENIATGYRYDECLKGSERLFGPLAGGLERLDSDLCLIHGVRSDTTNHPDGLKMLMRGARGARPGPFHPKLAEALAGDAPLAHLDMITPDGKAVFEEGPRPPWGDLRAQAHQAEIKELAASMPDMKTLKGPIGATAKLEKFLDDANKDAAALDAKFKGFLGTHFRLGFQAIRHNWAKCVTIASRGLYFDSHSDNFRYQSERQPTTWADLVTFVELLKATKNKYGSLFDQTTIVAFSEFGRYPRLNGQNGKDHWPENSWVLLGKGVKKGLTIGATDNLNKGVKIDFASGQPKQDGRSIFIDNTFATIAKISGLDPTKLGYNKDAIIPAVLA